jgi:hypothetical protein
MRRNGGKLQGDKVEQYRVDRFKTKPNIHEYKRKGSFTEENE